MIKNRTADVFRFIADYLTQHSGSPPTLREVCEGTGISSTNTVLHHVTKLQAEGVLYGRVIGSWDEDPSPSGRSKSRQMQIAGAAYGIPWNVLDGNLDTVTETSVYIDMNGEHSHELMVHFSRKKSVGTHWLGDPRNATMGFTVLHPNQIAIISDKPEHIFMGLAYGAAVYPPEHVWRKIDSEQ